MGRKNTFQLKVPSDSQVETYRVQLANGVVVTRTVDQLRAATPQEIAENG